MVEGEEEGDGQKEEGSRLFIIEDTFLLLPPKQSAVTAHLTVSIFMCVAAMMHFKDAHVCTLSSVNYHRVRFQVVASEPKNYTSNTRSWSQCTPVNKPSSSSCNFNPPAAVEEIWTS